MTRKTHQRGHQIEQLPHHRTVGIEPRFTETLRDRVPAVPPRHRLRQPIDRGKVEPECLADVAQRRARAVADHRRGQRGTITAVLGIEVLDHLLAPLMLEVDIDVGRLVALARDETLEQHLHTRRIDRGDAEAIAHRGIRRRAAPLAENVFGARECDDVVDGEKERFVARFGDELELVLDQAADLLQSLERNASRREAAGETFFGEPP